MCFSGIINQALQVKDLYNIFKYYVYIIASNEAIALTYETFTFSIYKDLICFESDPVKKKKELSLLL